MNGILKKIPGALKGEIIERQEPCKICKEKSGMQIGEVGYWNISTNKIVKCQRCGLVQLDPMLSEEETYKGCLAYSIEESLRVSDKEQRRNAFRNFRRGYLFGISLKRRGIYPKNVMELGPGSGYFACGLKYVFPDSRITVMDVNEEVLKFNRLHHGYETIQTPVEKHLPELDDKYDLIIARDILEHVIDISMVIKNVKQYLKEDGIFHFITPNGHEDVWKHYLTYKYQHTRSELLINHVNYFNGQGLLTFLGQNDFSPLQFYNYKLKTTAKGRGWKVSKKLTAPVSQNKNADDYITKKMTELQKINFNKEAILNKWYINNNLRFLIYLISWYHHANIIKLSPETNVGHETYGLFKITKSNLHPEYGFSTI